MDISTDIPMYLFWLFNMVCNIYFKGIGMTPDSTNKIWVTQEEHLKAVADKELNEILETLVNLCGGNLWWSYQTQEKNPAIADAKSQLLEIHGSNY